MDTIWVLLLTAVLVYFGLAVQTACDLLLDKPVRQANSGRRLPLLLAKCLIWPLILLDVVRVEGLMTGPEAAAYGAGLAEAAAPVSAGFREVQKARMDELRDSMGGSGKNRAKRKQRKKKRKKKRH